MSIYIFTTGVIKKLFFLFEASFGIVLNTPEEGSSSSGFDYTFGGSPIGNLVRLLLLGFLLFL